MLIEKEIFTTNPILLEGLLQNQNPLIIKSNGLAGRYEYQIECAQESHLIGVFSQVPDKLGSLKSTVFHTYSEIKSTFYILTYDKKEYTLFFCLTQEGQFVSLRGRPSGLILDIQNFDTIHKAALIVLRGKELYQILKEGITLSLQLTGGLGHVINEKLPAPKWFEKLGWESGAGLGMAVSHESVMNSVWNLRQLNLQPGFVLIEEGWQAVKKGALIDFEADKVRFPNGLKGLVDDLHRLGIKHIGVWHGITGGRMGIHRSLAEKYGLSANAEDLFLLGADLGMTFQFYHNYYEFLREQGITFTKVGIQGNLLSSCPANSDYILLVKNLQAAIQAASSLQFDSFHFNSDCLVNGLFFNWANSRIASTADRLQEDNPMGVMRSIRNHLSNGLWMQHFMQPDFDSWKTNHSNYSLLAVFHALSGTLNIVADNPGETDKALLRKMVLPSGKCLLTDRILTLCPDSVFTNPLETKKIYKAFTTKGECGLIAVFNLCSGRRICHGYVCPSDVVGLKGDSFAVFSHHSGFIGVYNFDAIIPISLRPAQADAIIISPIRLGIAVFGCHEFYVSPGTLIDVDIEEDSVHISMIVAGPLLLYCEKQVLEVRRNGQTVPWELDSKRKILSIDAQSPIIETHATYNILFE